ncbi:hypothetical protein E4U60_002274 [Claviceps pazoutovae]|uniref:Uncharacterized protein n=1 Tax=Claviceps pazoutovae TaxID=1649127 RepID=A0A9P7MJJ7_9HYPO|nr:hypothetical protein E4U60_002274 [Claviceps pazoutovae]
MMLRRLNRDRNGADSTEGESELSDPDSIGLQNDTEDEIVVNDGGNGVSLRSGGPEIVMDDRPDEAGGSCYPKRKRTSTHHLVRERNVESAHKSVSEKSPTSPESSTIHKPNRQSFGGPGVKGVLMGVWRDSRVPEVERRHAVIGFIDVRDRLRTRVQPNTKEGEPLAAEYPLPPGPGGSWVTFERVIFSDHLVGLDHLQVKEYTRLRSEAKPEETEDQRIAAETAAVREAIRRVKENPALEHPGQLPALAYGLDIPEHVQFAARPDLKRRKVYQASLERALEPSMPSSQQQATASRQSRVSIDPLPGNRPTRILIGYWKQSSELDPKDRHAVYGILGQNDMFRVKVVRETRDGRFVDGNFPSGAGALWIPYEEVEFEPHLQALSRQEVKEYCRVRQYQLDHGEMSADRIENETKAVFEAQTRAGTMLYRQPHNVTVPTFITSPQGDSNRFNGRVSYHGHELRQSRRPVPRPIRTSMSDNDFRLNAPERTNALARRDFSRAEATQSRPDFHAVHRDRATATATGPGTATGTGTGTGTAGASIPVTVEHHHNGDDGARSSHHHHHHHFRESEDMQRLNNKVWTRQETMCTTTKGSPDEAKMYDGVKYERKSTGPFVGKLVSQGTIINIDGEDYVEYRVLTKPSFF